MAEASRIARRFVVSGRVQGVGFRYFVRERAQALGLGGWVRNLPDGRVEAFVEGPRAAVESMEELLAEGPSMARVERVDGSEAAAGLATGFEIRR